MSIPTVLLRQSISMSADMAKIWFEDRTTKKTLDDFNKRGGLGDTKEGCVYVYFTEEGQAVYVGQTGRGVKARLYDQTSPHMKKLWWANWKYIRFIQLSDDMDRIALEFLLILAYAPTENQKPRAKRIDELLPL